MSNIIINVPNPKSPTPSTPYEYAGLETWGRRELAHAIHSLGHTPLITRGNSAYDLDRGEVDILRIDQGSSIVVPDTLDIDEIGAIRNVGGVINATGGLKELNHPSVRAIGRNPDLVSAVLKIAGVEVGSEYPDDEPVLRAFVFGKDDTGKLHTRYALMQNPTIAEAPNWKFVNEQEARTDLSEQVEAIHDAIQEETGVSEIHMAVDFSGNRTSLSPKSLKLQEPTLIYAKDHKPIGNQHAHLLAKQLVRLANK